MTENTVVTAVTTSAFEGDEIDFSGVDTEFHDYDFSQFKVAYKKIDQGKYLVIVQLEPGVVLRTQLNERSLAIMELSSEMQVLGADHPELFKMLQDEDAKDNLDAETLTKEEQKALATVSANMLKINEHRFGKPFLDEIKAYCDKNGYTFGLDYFEAIMEKLPKENVGKKKA